MGLLGSKNACEQGECGSCSVLLDGTLVCACLVLAMQVDGRDLVTIEGLAQHAALHPVQEAFVEAGGVQCGFCPPVPALSACGPAPSHTRSVRARDTRGPGRQSMPLHRLHKDSGRSPARRRQDGPAMTLVIDGCAIATVDGAGTEHAHGHLVIDGDRITSVAAGAAAHPSTATRI